MKMQCVQPCCSTVPTHIPQPRRGMRHEPTGQAEAGPAPLGDWEQEGHMGHACSLPAHHSPCSQPPSCQFPSGLGLMQLNQAVLDVAHKPEQSSQHAPD